MADIDTNSTVESVCKEVIARNPGEPEFHQAVREVTGSLGPVLDKYPEFAEAKVIERICEPDRQSMFRVPCEDIVSYEERKISRARASLEGARRVRAFFELHESEGEEDTGPLYRGTHQQVLEPTVDADRAQISDTPLYPGGRG